MDDLETGPFAQNPLTSAEPGPERGRRFRRNVVAVGAAIGLTLGGLGVAAAQTDSSTSTTAAPAAPAPPPAKPGNRGGPGKAGVGQATAAKAIGSSEADLKTALGNGQSVAQVAQAKGVDPAKVISALVDEAKAKLAEEVKAGRITQAQADERSADLQ
ncbi:MAG TPA: hypothetical protein VGP53_00080, partial [Acidimicrobiales bacterium]|nr:hypothetical protein [Acidimicrobiales bacterium]